MAVLTAVAELWRWPEGIHQDTLRLFVFVMGDAGSVQLFLQSGVDSASCWLIRAAQYARRARKVDNVTTSGGASAPEQFEVIR